MRVQVLTEDPITGLDTASGQYFIAKGGKDRGQQRNKFGAGNLDYAKVAAVHGGVPCT